MAKKNKQDKPEAAAQDATAEAPQDAFRSMSQDDAATLLAAKQEAGEPGRAWNLKKSTEIPDRFDGAEITILQPKRGSTPEETWQNILVFTNGDDEAALDTFNSAYRLDNQKYQKGLMGEKDVDLAALQEASNRHYATPTSRGKGGGRTSAKARAERAERKVAAVSQSMEEMLAELEAVNPEAAAKYRERLNNLN